MHSLRVEVSEHELSMPHFDVADPMRWSTDYAEDGSSVVRMTWSRLLKRTFGLDLERCLVCGARVFPEDFVLVDEPLVIAVTLRMLGIRSSAPARAPPRGSALDLDEDQSRPELDSDFDQSAPNVD